MPEKLLMSRGRDVKENHDETDWNSKYNDLTDNERKELINILCSNRNASQISIAQIKTKNGKLKKILDYYTLEEEIIEDENLTLPFDQDLENELYEN